MLVKNKYGFFFNDKAITEKEYKEILKELKKKPKAPENKGYRYTKEKKWVLYELPPIDYEALKKEYEELLKERLAILEELIKGVADVLYK